MKANTSRTAEQSDDEEPLQRQNAMKIQLQNGKFGYENKESLMDLVKSLHEEDCNSSESVSTAYGMNELKPMRARPRLLSNHSSEKKAQPKATES